MIFQKMKSRKNPSGLESLFEQALSALAPLRPGQKVLVGFSGGADSTALLHLSLAVKDKLGLVVAAAHLDHGLRDREAQRDRIATGKAAKEAGVRFYWDKVDCPALARREGLSPEEAAREARYDFLKRMREQIGADYILTGHTADDQAEAVLLNLLRGAGPRGLSGIPPVREGYILRPLLPFWREELTAYLTARGLTWVEDSSNQDRRLTRNRVRHELLPRLAQDYNPALKSALVRTAALLRDEEGFWAKIMAETKRQVVWSRSIDEIRMKASVLKALDRALARRLVREAVRTLQGQTQSLTFDHVENVLDGIAGGGPLGLDLPGTLKARREGGDLVVGLAPASGPAVPDYEYPLPLPGSVHLAEIGFNITTELVDWSPDFDLTGLGPDREAMDPAGLIPPLTVRNRRPGDRFRPLGMTGTKKLHDFFIDAKVPARQRSRTPLVVDGQGLVWVGGLRLADRVKITTKTRRILLLSLDR